MDSDVESSTVHYDTTLQDTHDMLLYVHSKKIISIDVPRYGEHAQPASLTPQWLVE